MATDKPKRRWSQFTLKTSLVVILVVAAFLAGRASMYATLEREHAQAKAEQARAEAATQVAEVSRLREAQARLVAEAARLQAEVAKAEFDAGWQSRRSGRREPHDSGALLRARTYRELLEEYRRRGLPPPVSGLPISPQVPVSETYEVRPESKPR